MSRSASATRHRALSALAGQRIPQAGDRAIWTSRVRLPDGRFSTVCCPVLVTEVSASGQTLWVTVDPGFNREYWCPWKHGQEYRWLRFGTNPYKNGELGGRLRMSGRAVRA